MKLSKNERKILEEIREEVLSTHWVKGKYTHITPSGKVAHCLTGFVNAKTNEGWDTNSYINRDGRFARTRRARILTALEDVIKERYKKIHLCHVEGFNDTPKTTRKVVVEVIDKALETH